MRSAEGLAKSLDCLDYRGLREASGGLLLGLGGELEQ
jgi:hypothetical protein